MTITSILERIRPPSLKTLLRDLPDEEWKWAEGVSHTITPSAAPNLQTFPYTERRVELVALRKIASYGQIDPARLRRMRTLDLEYLAGIPHIPEPREGSTTQLGNSLREQQLKVAENAHRAARELERRAIFRAQVMGTGLATVGATIAITVVQSLTG